MAPRASVIIINYNYGAFLPDEIESVLLQDLDPAVFGVIVADDESTDDSARRAQPYLDRIRWIAGKHGGQVAAFNAAFPLTGKGGEASNVMLPRSHRIAALSKRWLPGMHQGCVSGKQLAPYLDEFAFRFNRRLSKHRGRLFYRLVQQAVVTWPFPFKRLIKRR